MKQILAILAVVAMTLMSSCDKLPENGALDGRWQLMERYTHATPEALDYTVREDMKAKRIYWAFQLKLLSIKTYTSSLNEILARFRHTGSTLELPQIYIHLGARDSLLTDPATEALVPIGIHGNATTFDVIRLNGKQMILRSEQDSLVFRKF